MPYRLDGSDAPENVQKLPAKKRRQWIRIFNSSFARCQSEGGKDCEQTAFKMANGSVKPTTRS
jgi:hypothetical protein